MTTVSKRPIEGTLLVLPHDTNGAVLAIPRDMDRARISAFLVEPDRASLLDVDGIEHLIPSISLVDAHFVADLPLVICEVAEDQGEEIEYGIRAHVRQHSVDPQVWRTDISGAFNEPEETPLGMRP